MIQKAVIDAIYKRCSRRPMSPDELDIPLLFEKLPDEAGIEVDPDSIIIGSISPTSPFHKIPIENIHAILDFEEAVAIVLHSSIIFINKEDGSAHIHIREMRRSMLHKLLGTYPD